MRGDDSWDVGSQIDDGVADPAPPPREVPRLIGGFRVLAELARGGMGAVYRCQQTGAGRQVAIKVLLAGQRATPLQLQRFQAEGLALARLQHPHVVKVHHAGVDRGNPYLVMDLIEGESLEDRLTRSGAFEPKLAARVALDVARALTAAHALRIVHRDLKPANVLLDQGGRALLTDFGLAKQLDQSLGPTASGVMLGTPGFMPPEQAIGEPADERADVYGLGATLYALLTGEAPFGNAEPLVVLAMIVERRPPPLRRQRREIPPDLETICLRCLEKKPERRYSSAAALAEDLERFLRGEPIVARRASWALERVRSVGKGPAIAVALFFGIAAAAVSWFALSARVADETPAADAGVPTQVASPRDASDPLLQLSPLQALHREAQEAIAAGRWERAQEVSALALEQDPASDWAITYTAVGDWVLWLDPFASERIPEDAAGPLACSARVALRAVGMSHEFAVSDVEADSCLEPVVSRDEERLWGLLLQGQILALRLGRAEEALVVVGQLERLQPSFPDHHLLKATALAQLHDPQAALRTLTALLEIEPLSRAYRWRGELYHRVGEFGWAKADWTRACELSPRDERAAGLLVQELLRENDEEAAAAELDRLSFLAPRRFPNLALCQVELYLRKEAWLQAAEESRRALERWPHRYAGVRRGLMRYEAAARASLGELDEAERLYLAGYEPELAGANSLLGKFYRAHWKDPTEALTYLLRWARLAPDEPEVHFEVAQALQESGAPQAAVLAAYDQGLTIPSRNVKDLRIRRFMLSERSKVRAHQGDLPGAIEDRRETLELLSTARVSADLLCCSWHELADLHELEGDPEEQKRCASRATELNPKDAEAHYTLARAYHQLGDYDATLASLLEAIGLPGTVRDVATGLALHVLTDHQGLPLNALGTIDSLRKQGAEFAELYVGATRALRVEGRLAEAGPAVARALELDPLHPEAWLERGLLERERGEPGVESLRRFLELARPTSPCQREEVEQIRSLLAGD